MWPGEVFNLYIYQILKSQSIIHIYLFFDCVVARQLWSDMSEVLDRDVGADFASIGTLWLSNIFFCCPMGALEAENCLCFQDMRWKNGHCLLQKVTAMTQSWSLLCPKEMQGEFMSRLDRMKSFYSRPLRITGWTKYTTSGRGTPFNMGEVPTITATLVVSSLKGATHHLDISIYVGQFLDATMNAPKDSDGRANPPAMFLLHSSFFIFILILECSLFIILY